MLKATFTLISGTTAEVTPDEEGIGGAYSAAAAAAEFIAFLIVFGTLLSDSGIKYEERQEAKDCMPSALTCAKAIIYTIAAATYIFRYKP